MDPLSVTASIIGILTAAANITNAICAFTSAIQDTPRLARSVSFEIEALSAIFSQLQGFLRQESLERKGSSPLVKRMSMTTVEQFVRILGSCVLTFSELEEEIDDLGDPENDGVWSRVKWNQKQTVLREILADLQQQKLSLSLMIGVWNCRTNVEAMQKYELLSETLSSREDRLSRQASTASLSSNYYITQALDLQIPTTQKSKNTTQRNPMIDFRRRRSTTSLLFIPTMSEKHPSSNTRVVSSACMSLDQVEDLNKLSVPVSARELYHGKKFTRSSTSSWGRSRSGPQGFVAKFTSALWPLNKEGVEVMEISRPFGFKHTTHIGVYTETGKIRIVGEETPETEMVRKNGWMR